MENRWFFIVINLLALLFFTNVSISFNGGFSNQGQADNSEVEGGENRANNFLENSSSGFSRLKITDEDSLISKLTSECTRSLKDWEVELVVGAIRKGLDIKYLKRDFFKKNKNLIDKIILEYFRVFITIFGYLRRENSLDLQNVSTLESVLKDYFLKFEIFGGEEEKESIINGLLWLRDDIILRAFFQKGKRGGTVKKGCRFWVDRQNISRMQQLFFYFFSQEASSENTLLALDQDVKGLVNKYFDRILKIIKNAPTTNQLSFTQKLFPRKILKECDDCFDKKEEEKNNFIDLKISCSQ